MTRSKCSKPSNVKPLTNPNSHIIIIIINNNQYIVRPPSSFLPIALFNKSRFLIRYNEKPAATGAYPHHLHQFVLTPDSILLWAINVIRFQYSMAKIRCLSRFDAYICMLLGFILTRSSNNLNVVRPFG